MVAKSVFWQPGLFSILERVAERAVAQIMQQRGKQSCPFAVALAFVPGHIPPRHLHKPPRDVEYTDRVGEPRMSGSREGELRDAQLLDPSQTLEFGCVDQPPSRAVNLVLQIEGH